MDIKRPPFGVVFYGENNVFNITVVMFGILCVITYVLFVLGERFVRHIGASALGGDHADDGAYSSGDWDSDGDRWLKRCL
jgi:hypothetical protein